MASPPVSVEAVCGQSGSKLINLDVCGFSLSVMMVPAEGGTELIRDFFILWMLFFLCEIPHRFFIFQLHTQITHFIKEITQHAKYTLKYKPKHSGESQLKFSLEITDFQRLHMISPFFWFLFFCLLVLESRQCFHLMSKFHFELLNSVFFPVHLDIWMWNFPSNFS